MIDFLKAVDQLIAKDKELQAAIKQVQEQQARQHEIQRTREEISKKDQEILNLESQLKEAEKILVSEEAQVLVKAIMFCCVQSRTQSPQAFWSVSGRQERLWRIKKN